MNENMNNIKNQKIGALIVMEIVKKLFPEIILIHAHADNNTFYYEFGVKKPLSNEDIAVIKSHVNLYASKISSIQQYRIKKEDAFWLFRSEPVKLIQLSENRSRAPKICQINEFYDLCEESLEIDPSNRFHIVNIQGKIPMQEIGNLPWIKQRIYGSVRI
ncbi:MAG: hypothetical protein K9W44_17130 [Candidatus Lokiarchaeota archaeon]|nr:hypothetical protein [Candidatus Harpocratesius repetitus]